MKLNNKKIIFIIILCCQFYCYSQKPNFYGTFDFIADNREYFSKYAYAQTILGGMVDIGAEFKLDTIHTFYLGTNYFYEYGYTLDAYLPVLDMYYNYSKKFFNFKFGSFPRKNILNYPLVLLADTLLYYRPNIQGAFGQLNTKFGHQNIWIDWTSRQTRTIRETFLAGMSGEFHFNIFYFENYFYMYHQALSKNPSPDDHIRDNGGGSGHLGINLSNIIPIDILKFDAGTVISYDRYRPNPYKSAIGYIGRINLKYKIAGIEGITYFGDKQHLANGDPFYSSGSYSRINLYIIPFFSERINSKFILGMHFAEDELDFSQQLLISVNFIK